MPEEDPQQAAEQVQAERQSQGWQVLSIQNQGDDHPQAR